MRERRSTPWQPDVATMRMAARNMFAEIESEINVERQSAREQENDDKVMAEALQDTSSTDMSREVQEGRSEGEVLLPQVGVRASTRSSR